ncbi:CatB-related O-acetyltransferase [Polaribacter staleyi]|uniref:CatB-related O-acetyltransferase n=1 Tax=Polaribacter staleyi TaxID=2022337 RepID=UPI0031BB4A3B
MNIIKKIFYKFFKELSPFYYKDINLTENILKNVKMGDLTKVYKPYRILSVEIGKGTYISENSKITITKIGKFCSIGPNLVCGWGIHPTNGISTNPYFYSNRKQNGSTISDSNLLEERKKIVIGNDVFIGANVTILDGIRIGDGAIIGAGSVVSKNIPDYAIAYGVPIEVKKFRFNKEERKKIKQTNWWDGNEEKLNKVKENFYDIDNFLNEYNG